MCGYTINAMQLLPYHHFNLHPRNTITQAIGTSAVAGRAPKALKKHTVRGSSDSAFRKKAANVVCPYLSLTHPLTHSVV